jgi:hypothetical protein
MRKSYASNDEYFDDLQSLVEAWCDRRCLHALSTILPAYTSFNGMTDAWGDLLTALNALLLSNDVFLPDERQIIADLKQAAENAVYRQ